MVNVPMLRKVVEWVEEQADLPEAECMWDQTTWFGEAYCGTTYCVAGYVAYLEGWQPVGRAKVERKGVVRDVADVAASTLEITELEAERLFSGFNGAKDVRDFAEEIAGEPL